MQLNIGKRLRNLRKKKGLSILQLSELCDVSTGMISQIERDLVVPTVVSIWRIAQALDTNISYFFDEEKPQDRTIIRKNEHKTIIMNKGCGLYELLSSDHENHIIDFVKITLKSGQVYDINDITHEGEECGYILSGTMTVRLNGENYELHEGDSIYFNSNLPHKYMNLHENDCISIWAMTPPFF